MTSDTAQRLASELTREGLDWAILTSPEAVGYVTGKPRPVETGTSPFAGGPSAAIVTADGRCIEVGTNLETGPTLADSMVSYVGFSAQPQDLSANYRDALNDALDLAGAVGVAGVEFTSLPATVAELVTSRGHGTREVGSALARARARKTEREIALLRESGRVAAAGQRAARERAEPGITELELFAHVRLTVETLAGGRVPFAGDLASGVERTAAAGGWPGNRVLQAGDLVMSDLAPRIGGYWADSCNTFALGDPSREQRILFDSVLAALAVAEGVARVGVSASDIDDAVRRHLDRDGFHYPHHTGHSIGTSVHESPRIIPGEPGELEAGMVILLEPGAYVEGVGGVRLERMYLVTKDGLEVLTEFPMQLGAAG